MLGGIVAERLAGRPFLTRSSTGHRGRITPFSASKQRGHDTQYREHSARHESSTQAGHERLLQRLRLLDAESLPAGCQGRTGRRAAEAREDRARHPTLRL